VPSFWLRAIARVEGSVVLARLWQAVFLAQILWAGETIISHSNSDGQRKWANSDRSAGQKRKKEGARAGACCCFHYCVAMELRRSDWNMTQRRLVATGV